jgi:hypothetical protein
MAASMILVNLEEGMPTVEQAERLLTSELGRARASGAKVVKLIHGYGSSGVGGKLRVSVRQFLGTKKRRNTIKAFVSGEEWDIFNEESRRMIEACPDLSRDRDLGRGNAGITIVLL